MDYKEVNDLLENDFPENNEVLERVTTGVVVAANNILDGGTTGTAAQKYAKRKWAAHVLYNPVAEGKKAARLIVTNNIELPLAQVISAVKNDDLVQTQVNAVVNELVQALAGKDATD